MKLATHRDGVEGAARLGMIVGDFMVDVGRLGAARGVPLPDTMLGMIDHGQPGLAAILRSRLFSATR